MADAVPAGFKAVDESTMAAYLEAHSELAGRLGGSPQDWSVREVGDGNINFVYIVQGPSGGLVIKQALPYIRCVGESWPMTLERINFEATALQEEFKLVPAHVPEVYRHDPSMALMAMEYLQPPHIILRKGLIRALPYPLLADHVSTFLARTLFGTSLLANSTSSFRPQVAKFCRNVDMCRLTEQVIFTEPYYEASNNHWTTPQLDEDARAIREDLELKLEIAALKKKFCESSEALLHGDLHTGSIMATPDSTKVFDAEFAFYGPMGFDVGAFLANLLLAYFSQAGHATPEDSREEYKKWILETFQQTWVQFEAKFRALWSASVAASLPQSQATSHGAAAEEPTPTASGSSQGEPSGSGFQAGDAYQITVFHSPEAVAAAQDAYFRNLLADSLGFAGAKMIRRIVGIAHVEDLESIADADKRAQCERQALNVGKRLVKERASFKSIADVVAAVTSA